MKVNQIIQKVMKLPTMIGCAVGILVVSLGLLCLDPPGRSGGHGCGIGLTLGRCSARLLSCDGAVAFAMDWNSPSSDRNGLRLATCSHLGEYRYGLHLNGLGFGFGVLPTRVSGNDFSVSPHIGFTIPLWFTSALAIGILLLCRHLRVSTENRHVHGPVSGRCTFVQHWLLTCLLTLVGAELFWLGAQYVMKFDALELPLSAPLLPVVLLLDSREARVSPSEWLPYAVVFWPALFSLSLVLSRRRTHPAIAGAVLLGLTCAFGVLVALVAT